MQHQLTSAKESQEMVPSTTLYQSSLTLRLSTTLQNLQISHSSKLRFSFSWSSFIQGFGKSKRVGMVFLNTNTNKILEQWIFNPIKYNELWISSALYIINSRVFWFFLFVYFFNVYSQRWCLSTIGSWWQSI